MTILWILVTLAALVFAVAEVVDAILSGPELQAVRIGWEGVRLLLSVGAVAVLIALLGLPMSAGPVALVALVGMLIGFVVTTRRGFTVRTGLAIVQRWAAPVVVGGLSGVLLIIGLMASGRRPVDVGLLGLLFVTGAEMGRYLALFRMDAAAETELMAEILVLGERTCPNCGMAVSAVLHSCPACGADLGRFCPRCGSPISASDRFCAACGEPVAPPEPDPVPGQVTQRSCILCGTPLGMAARYCDRCSMEQPAACPVCGTALLPGVSECPLCGIPLSTERVPDSRLV